MGFLTLSLTKTIEWSLIGRCITLLTSTELLEETRITSSRDSVVAVILVGFVMSCFKFISVQNFSKALYSVPVFLRPSQFRSPKIVIGLSSSKA